jgi:hypothetical protein
MAWIDVTSSFRPEEGNVVNIGDIVYVSIGITNNLPWPLKKNQFHLLKVTGEAHLEPAGTPLPKKVVGPEEIAPGATAVQDFVLKADAEGNATADMEFVWVLDDTTLTFDVKTGISFSIYPI